MPNKPKVMVVDDDDISQTLIEGILEESFDLTFASSGNECLDKLQSSATEVVLLDVNMPGMNGLEVCRAIRMLEQHQNIPIIFVSASDTKEEIIAGYEAGADDYITKPLHHDALLARVEMNALQARTQAHIQNTLTGTSPESINRQFINSPVFQFIDLSSQAATYEDLARAIFEITTHMELSCLIQIVGPYDTCHFSDDGTIKPIEPSIIQQMKSQGRCCSFGQRLIINYPEISLFVRNMPLNDELRNVQIKEALLHVVRLADSRLETIQLKNTLEKDCEGLRQSLRASSETLGFIHQDFCRHTKKVNEVLDSIGTDMLSSLETLHLTCEQEEFITGIVHNKMNNLLQLNNKSLQIEESMLHFIEELSKN
ncbi:hypothetical protein A9Q99_20850 [Gammaproteobacteria bacterium 45_16_T64]|nr:hypothetical protein A9Q99_20850 [Gammaproteobacteria bacterium 45_16_T64]